VAIKGIRLGRGVDGNRMNSETDDVLVAIKGIRLGRGVDGNRMNSETDDVLVAVKGIRLGRGVDGNGMSRRRGRCRRCRRRRRWRFDNLELESVVNFTMSTSNTTLHTVNQELCPTVIQLMVSLSFGSRRYH
jgi:hypothetical protein